MSRTTSVAMTGHTEQALLDLLIRDDGQEDLCLTLYRPSTGACRSTALVSSVIPPGDSDREVHGNATVSGDYILRGAHAARDQGCGLALAHSHPAGTGWQPMSGPDREAESSYANLAREITGLPLVGMTLAGGDTTWSARHWDTGTGTDVDCTHATNVRVIGDRLAVSWNNALSPPPPATRKQTRTVSAWGPDRQADLARRKVLVVGAGSVGLDIAVRLAASGLQHLTVMDFDIVEDHNLDRLIGAAPRDARLRRSKTHVARRVMRAAATAEHPSIEVSDLSVCEPQGLHLALDHDLIFSCVDQPWPRAVLNAMAYSDLIPVIDGGIAIDTSPDGAMRNATWRTHIVRPGRPCMACNRQLDMAQVTLDKQGLLDDPAYIAQAGASTAAAELVAGQNVATLSASVSAGLLAQYVSFSVAPAGIGEPGPLQYSLNSHFLDHRDDHTRAHCPTEPAEAVGDQRHDLTGPHPQAQRQRLQAAHPRARIRLLRWLDDTAQALITRLDRA